MNGAAVVTDDNRRRPRRRRARRNVLVGAWVDERDAARSARARGEREPEWTHLERAHVLSQPLAGPHVRNHLAMLSYGFRHHDRREIVGQLIRLVVAAPGSWTGRYPSGNTGGVGVSALLPMPIPDDLRVVIEGTPDSKEVA